MRLLLAAAGQRGCDGIKNVIKLLADILGQESQNHITVLLEQRILPSVSPVCLGTGKMLRAVQLDANAGKPACFCSGNAMRFPNPPFGKVSWFGKNRS